jgi:hypothetical protein
MTRVKVTRRPSETAIGKQKEWPVVVYMWTIGLAVVSYAVTRAVLDGKPHPYHWAAALLGGLVGIPLGWLWFRWRGDLF